MPAEGGGGGGSALGQLAVLALYGTLTAYQAGAFESKPSKDAQDLRWARANGYYQPTGKCVGWFAARESALSNVLGPDGIKGINLILGSDVNSINRFFGPGKTELVPQNSCLTKFATGPKESAPYWKLRKALGDGYTAADVVTILQQFGREGVTVPDTSGTPTTPPGTPTTGTGSASPSTTGFGLPGLDLEGLYNAAVKADQVAQLVNILSQLGASPQTGGAVMPVGESLNFGSLANLLNAGANVITAVKGTPVGGTATTAQQQLAQLVAQIAAQNGNPAAGMPIYTVANAGTQALVGAGVDAAQAMLASQASGGSVCAAPVAGTPRAHYPATVQGLRVTASGMKKVVTYKNMGEPLLYAGDVAAVKRVRKVARLTARACPSGTRRTARRGRR